MRKTIAIIGATGNVGRKILDVFFERKLNEFFSLRLFASPKSVGLKLVIEETTFTVESLDSYDFKDCCVALFAVDADIAQHYVQKAIDAGAKVIDSSSYYRLNSLVPLIVPPINIDLVNSSHSLYAIANCVACPVALVLKPLHDVAIVKRVCISTYQSTSGAGKKEMDELYLQTKAYIEGSFYQGELFPRKIAFNVIPQVDKFLDDGFTYEEYKIIKEIQRILSTNIKITITTVRVPVLIGHSIAMFIELSKPFELKQIKELLAASPGIKLSENYHTPIEVEGKNDVYVGRIRLDSTVDNGLLLWATSDNLRRGAALDMVEIAEKILSSLDNRDTN